MIPKEFREVADRDEILRTLRVLGRFGVVELRALNTQGGGRIVSGYFAPEHFDDMADEAVYWSEHAEGVYSTLNPVDPEMLARANNRVNKYVQHATKAEEIIRRVWLLIDTDPKRPAGISATDAEHETALERAKQIREYLRGLGWPDPIFADSGNGAHLLYRIDLPNDDAATDLVKRCLKALASMWSDSAVDVDKKVFDANRISKLYGTVARKGDDMPDRPHRLSKMLEIPGLMDVVPIEALEELAGSEPAKAEPRPGSNGDTFDSLTSAGGLSFNLERWIEQWKLPVVGPSKPFAKGGRIWVLNPCPFNPDHTNMAAYVGQLADGALFAGCHHNGCADMDWHALRDIFEPGWRTGRRGIHRVTGEADSTEVEPIEDVADPHRLARLHLKLSCSHPDGWTLRFHLGTWYKWTGRAYRAVDYQDIYLDLHQLVKSEFDRESIEAQKRNDAGESVARKVTKAIVNNVADALASMVRVPSDRSAPCWLDGDGPWPADEVLPATNGLFSIARLARGEGEPMPHTPRFFSTFSLNFAVSLDAHTPTAWLKHMDDLLGVRTDIIEGGHSVDPEATDEVWNGDPECIAALQEWMGYCLVQDMSQHKILLLLGPPRSGKGIITNVIRELIGPDNVIGPQLPSLKGAFGLQPFLDKTLAIFSDARLQGTSDLVTERFLSISGGDPLTIERKHISSITVHLKTRIMLVSNEPPRFRDASGALARRMIPLQLKRSFLDVEDLTLSERLREELPGILLWAIEGWKRLKERGRFVLPASSKVKVKELECQSSDIKAFLNDRCIVSPYHNVDTMNLYNAYCTWCERNGIRYKYAENTFGLYLRIAVPDIYTSQPRVPGGNGARHRIYVGVGLLPD